MWDNHSQLAVHDFASSLTPCKPYNAYPWTQDQQDLLLGHKEKQLTRKNPKHSYPQIKRLHNFLFLCQSYCSGQVKGVSFDIMFSEMDKIILELFCEIYFSKFPFHFVPVWQPKITKLEDSVVWRWAFDAAVFYKTIHKFYGQKWFQIKTSAYRGSKCFLYDFFEILRSHFHAIIDPLH